MGLFAHLTSPVPPPAFPRPPISSPAHPREEHKLPLPPPPLPLPRSPLSLPPSHYPPNTHTQCAPRHHTLFHPHCSYDLLEDDELLILRRAMGGGEGVGAGLVPLPLEDEEDEEDDE